MNWIPWIIVVILVIGIVWAWFKTNKKLRP